MDIITGTLNRTVEPTKIQHQFIVTDHFIFDGKPVTEDHVVYDCHNCDEYLLHLEAIRSNNRDDDDDYSYAGPQEIIVAGKTYYFPKFLCND